MKYKQWNVAAPHPELCQRLQEQGIPGLLAAVLSARGVAQPEEARRLFRPKEEPVLDPMLLRDMDKAVARIRLAVERGEWISIFGDYDVDGITSTCLLTEYLRRLGGRVIPYIPGRLEEGYGLNREAVNCLARQGVTLIVTVDCGITAVEEVDYAAQMGIEVVITDHHTCKDELPRAVAVVDPHRSDCPYPFKGLAGVGVALKLAMAIAGPADMDAVLEEYCDLAAVGTVADVMPMTGENRAVVSRGLAKLTPGGRMGLVKLMEAAGVGDKPVTTVTVGYTLAPRINASGRMCRAEVAVELLLTQDPGRCEELAQELCEMNRERQTIESEIFQQCMQQLEQAPQQGAVVLADSRWHQGVVGIVASRLAEKYACPAFMICLDQGVGKGSCRSWGGVNLFELLGRCSHLLESFGGHALAAGFTVREEQIPALAQALRQAIALEHNGGELPSELDVDAAVTPDLLTVEAVEALDLLEPWGSGNPRPVLVWNAAQIQSMTQVGRGRHLKLRLESRGAVLDAIWFSADGGELGLAPGGRVDVAFSPQINEFRGLRSVQLQILDLRPAPSRAQKERDIYERFRRGDGLTAQEASFLLPSRGEFVDLWRWLERQTALSTVVEDTLPRIARAVARAGGQSEVPTRTLLCLQVMEERGLIELKEQTGRFRITLRRLEHKVDLEASVIMKQLREALQPNGLQHSDFDVGR